MAERPLQVLPIPELVDMQSLAVTATVAAGGKQSQHSLTASKQGAWYLSLSDDHSGTGQVNVIMTGKRQNGRPFESRIGPLSFGEKTPTTTTPDHQTAVTPASSPTTKTAPVPAEPPISENMEPEKPGWAFVTSQVLLFNILAGFAVFFVYRKWFKKQSAAANPLEELDHA